MSFKEKLQASFKSEDTEEWIDVHFTRPVGLVLAIGADKIDMHPNTVTIISIVIGVASAFFFYSTDVVSNLCGVLLLMTANFLDSADGQLARLTGKKTIKGRMLDGFAGDGWFFSVYFAICMRVMPQQMPLIGIEWGPWIWILGFLAGIMSHSPQSSLSDYYRQIHLFFLKGKAGAEFDTYESQHAIYTSLPRKGAFWDRAFYFNYQNYCHSQEKRTPQFQRLMAVIKDIYGGADKLPQHLRDEFRKGSLPLMPLTNILTFNTRAICLYLACLANIPWAYFLVEITVFNMMYAYMWRRHERLCAHIVERIGKYE